MPYLQVDRSAAFWSHTSHNACWLAYRKWAIWAQIYIQCLCILIFSTQITLSVYPEWWEGQRWNLTYSGKDTGVNELRRLMVRSHLHLQWKKHWRTSSCTPYFFFSVSFLRAMTSEHIFISRVHFALCYSLSSGNFIPSWASVLTTGVTGSKSLPVGDTILLGSMPMLSDFSKHLPEHQTHPFQNDTSWPCLLPPWLLS